MWNLRECGIRRWRNRETDSLRFLGLLPVLRYGAQPGGTGPTRVTAMLPDRPELVPAVNAYVNVAVEQPWNVHVPVPTASVVCVVGVGVSNWPPLVS